MKELLIAFLTLAGAALAGPAGSTDVAPKPLFRDPVYDGAADPSIVYDRTAGAWKMFYTNRRATMHLPDREDVAWVHGTRIGIASSKDGVRWVYQGVAEFPAACTDITSWAPELYYEAGLYHMWLTVVPGIFHRWGAPGATARIVHLTSKDLSSWICAGDVDAGSSRKIDPTVLKLGNKYRMWYKDEAFGSRIVAADSPDLKRWTPVGKAPITDTRGEGPKAFRFKGHYWMIADAWKGLMVLRSDDALHWTQQADFLLSKAGMAPTDRGLGQHPDVIVDGNRAFLFYFVHQANEPEARSDPYWGQRTAIQVTELKYRSGKLSVDRDQPLRFRLMRPSK